MLMKNLIFFFKPRWIQDDFFAIVLSADKMKNVWNLRAWGLTFIQFVHHSRSITDQCPGEYLKIELPHSIWDHKLTLCSSGQQG